VHPDELTPFMVVSRHEEGGVVAMLNLREFDNPGQWGIAIADIVQHVINAYASEGMHPLMCRQELLHYLMSELDSPTDKAEMVRDFDWGEE
jgi:hypothetical protein